MMPGLSTWKQSICEIIASEYDVQPSEFWKMDLEELNFWREITSIITQARKKQMQR